MQDIDKENQKNIFIKLDEFDVSVRLSNMFKEQNLLYVGDLAILERSQLLRFQNLGQETIKEIDSLLNSLGLYLGMNIPDWPPDGKVDEILNKNISLKINRPVNTVTEKKIQIKDYELHKKNNFFHYLSSEEKNTVTRLRNFYSGIITIGDLAKKNINFNQLYRTHNIGGKSVSLLKYYSKLENLESLILSRPDLVKKDLSDAGPDKIEKIIIKDIENIRNQYNNREKIIFDRHFGYKCDVLTLIRIAEEISKIEGRTLTRERIRQIVNKLKRKLVTHTADHTEDVRIFLQKNMEKGFHEIFPNLDSLFTDTVSFKAHDIKGDRLTPFLELYCGLEEGSLQTPDRILKSNFNPGNLIEIFSEVPSPINFDDFIEDVMEVFGYKKATATESIKYMEKNNLIKVHKNKIYPIKINKVNEMTHIFLKFPNGLFWKDGYHIMNNSFTPNSHDLKRIMPDHTINQNPLLWLSDKGTYKHIKYLDCKELSEQILENVLEVFNKKNSKQIKLIQIYNILKKRNIKPACETDYYELRTIIRNYGEKKGLYFTGKSGVDTIGVHKNFEYLTAKDSVLDIIRKSEHVIHQDAIANMLKKDKSDNLKAMVYLWCEQLLQEGKIMRVGPKEWFERNKSIKMCNIDLVLENLMKLFDRFEIISVNYFTRYINEKMNLAFSYYYYDSIFKIYSKKKSLFYSNNYLCKKKMDIGTKLIYQKYFRKDLKVSENIKRVQNLGIAVLRTQFLNAAYYYK